MPYEFYKIVHLVGIVLLFTALGGLTLHVVNGGDKASNRGRAMVAAAHGIAMLLLLVAGFGMLAKLKIAWPWPGWVFAKVGIWLLFGALLAVPYKKPQLAKPIFWSLPVLGGIAAWLAVMHPF